MKPGSLLEKPPRAQSHTISRLLRDPVHGVGAIFYPVMRISGSTISAVMADPEILMTRRPLHGATAVLDS